MESDDEIHGMEIPDGFRIQASKPAALDSSLLQRGVLVRLGMGWFGGLITRQSQERTRHIYDYHRVQLDPSWTKAQHDEAAVGNVQWRSGCGVGLVGLA